MAALFFAARASPSACQTPSGSGRRRGRSLRRLTPMRTAGRSVYGSAVLAFCSPSYDHGRSTAPLGGSGRMAGAALPCSTRPRSMATTGLRAPSPFSGGASGSATASGPDRRSTRTPPAAIGDARGSCGHADPAAARAVVARGVDTQKNVGQASTAVYPRRPAQWYVPRSPKVARASVAPLTRVWARFGVGGPRAAGRCVLCVACNILYLNDVKQSYCADSVVSRCCW